MRKRKLKKIHSQIHTDIDGSWAISYGDMITLLLSFFVIFFSFDFNKENEAKLEESAIKNIGLMDTMKDKNDGFSENSTAKIEEISEVTAVVKKKNDNIVVFFKGANFFESGATTVNDYGKVLLDNFVEKYLPYAGKFKLKIQAFTDNKPVRQNAHRFQDNVELSALRSISVMRYLQKNGVPLHRVEISGKGIMSPNALSILGLETQNETEVRKMSRTIAFVLHREDLK